MEKVFNNGSVGDARQILVRITGGYIEFFFYDQYLRQLNWINEETERRLESDEEELTEEEKGNHSFYWFSSDEWTKDKTQRLDRPDNWHKHMERKNWFTKEMADYINKFTLYP
jgi:hypothetical protein